MLEGLPLYSQVKRPSYRKVRLRSSMIVIDAKTRSTLLVSSSRMRFAPLVSTTSSLTSRSSANFFATRNSLPVEVAILVRPIRNVGIEAYSERA